MTDPTTAGTVLARLVRTEHGPVLATLIRLTGSVGLAEDVVQDAVERALATWPRDGVPANPRAWLLLTAKRRAIDLIRREAARTGKEVDAVRLHELGQPDPVDSAVRDDLLRLLFTCCHPALALETQVALALRTLGGLTTGEVARALLVPEPTMAKRLTRAKQKIVQARIPYRVPADEELPGRLAGVAATVYLVFNEGYAAGVGDDVMRRSLTEEALRLGRLLVRLMPDEPTVLGLTALMLLQDSRRDARVDERGEPVPLAEQDRSLWDQKEIGEGVRLIVDGLRRTPTRPDRYVVQAAIAGCHAIAADYARTDWDAVLAWYDVLLGMRDDPVVRLNRAVALGERDGPAVGLAAVDAVGGLSGYPWWHAARAELLRRLGRIDEARQAASTAAGTGLPEAYARRLRRQIG